MATLGIGPTRPPRPLCEPETAATRGGGGQKCSVITQSAAHADPPSGLTETGQTPTKQPCACTRPPGGSSRQLRNVRTEIRQGLQLEGEFQPSSFCLGFASPRSTSASVVIPAACFHIVLAQGRGGGSRRLRHPSVTGNESQTPAAIRLKIQTTAERSRKSRADEESLC